MKIFLVAKDNNGSRQLQNFFAIEGYDVERLNDKSRVAEELQRQNQGLVIIDGESAVVDSLHLCGALADRRGVGIILLASPVDPLAPVLGLELGADDVLVTPFSRRELLARARAIMRRRAPMAPAGVLEAQGWSLVLNGRELRSPAGRSYFLTSNEFTIVRLFISRPDRVLTREDLSVALHPSGVQPQSRSVDVHISRLRAKLGPEGRDFIRTVRQGGYRLLSPAGEPFGIGLHARPALQRRHGARA